MQIQLQSLAEIAREDKIAYRTAIKRMQEKWTYIGFYVERYGGKGEGKNGIPEDEIPSKIKKVRGYLRKKDLIQYVYNLIEEWNQ